MELSNLEKYLYSNEEDLSQFPANKNYVSIYKSFKDFMNREVHPEIKTRTNRLDNTVYLNDHGERHVGMVMRKASNILDDISHLHPYECFILLVAIQIHDAGHIFKGREGHEKSSRLLLEKIDIDSIEKKIIGDIARAHSGKADPIGKLERETFVAGVKVRQRELAAFLRLGDEMADETSRASKYLLQKDLIDEESILFHAFSESLYNFSSDKKGHSIQMKFILNKEKTVHQYTRKGKPVFLLDEIYQRTFKTFQECIYYNRFVPYDFQFFSIKVTIDFNEDNQDEPFFEQISYSIEEKGYPLISPNNIFDYCDIKRITGEDVKKIIEQEDERKSI